MAEEQVDPFGVAQPKPQQTAFEGMPSRFGGLPESEGGSYFQLSPEAMQMMWAPQPQIGAKLYCAGMETVD